MSCREIQDRLADNPQAARTDPALCAHLAACPACRALAEKLRGVDAALAGLAAQPPPPAWVVERTLARVAAEPPGRSRSRRRLRWAVVATAVSASFLLLVSGLVVMGPTLRELTASSANALAGNEEAKDLPDHFAQLEFKGEEGKLRAKRLHGHRSMKDFSEQNQRGEHETTTAKLPVGDAAVADPGRDAPPTDDRPEGRDVDEDGVVDDVVGDVVGGVMAGEREARLDTGKRDEPSELDRRLGRYEQTRTRLMLLEAEERLVAGQQRHGWLDLASLPEGGRVMVDGTEIDGKDKTVRLPPGVHHLRLERSGEAPVDQNIELENGVVSTLELVPQQGQPGRGPGLFDGEQTPLDALAYLPAQGYFRNTYLPGDPELAWLREGLAEGLWLDGRRTRLDLLAQPYRQPFDPPARGGLALSLGADRLAADGPTRLLLQVGLKGAERPASRRSALEAVLLVDLRRLPDEEARRALWSLADALAEARQAGDRFALVVAGGPAPQLLAPEKFEPAAARKLLADALLAIEARGPTAELGPALERAYAALARPGAEDAPLGSQLVLLATAGPLGEEREALELRAHQAARQGVSLSALGVGTGAPADELAELALAGQGRRRLLLAASEARGVLETELTAGGSVVARAVRLRIRLSPGVRLVSMLGSAPLEAPAAERVREAERAIDQKVAHDLGVAADRGDDEDGIQVVIPAFYAGDEHVLLLDVVAAGPGPLAEVRVRAKDLVSLENAVLTQRLDLAPGERPLDRRCLAVRKNALAFRLAGDLSAAGERLASGDGQGARARLAAASARAARFLAEHPSLAGDPELARDVDLLAAYGRALDGHAQAQAPAGEELARSLLAAGKSKLAFARAR
ncbi:MAG TPA: hypothetical protein PK668_22850 [Myxococcota bacterium]|nr:hypothetical protein [Myxococcota bacterium]HRY95534.1 hypothetical protein [Myxococcota bacterium]HSA19936.1 hypothetical protein [Myxococcota bacterium]